MIPDKHSNSLLGDRIIGHVTKCDYKEPLMKVKEESEKIGLKLNIQKSKILASGPITSWPKKYIGKQWKQWQTLFSWAPKSLQMVTAAMKLKDAYSLEEKWWPTERVYSKAETLLCQQRSVQSRLWFFLWSCMDVRVGLWRKLSTEELMLLTCGVGEDSWESLGLQGDPTSPS